MDNKRYAFHVPDLKLETLHTYARLVKEMFPEIYTSYVEGLTEIDLETDIPAEYNQGCFLVSDRDGNLCWGWNPSKYFCEPYEVISLDDNVNREFLGGI